MAYHRHSPEQNIARSLSPIRRCNRIQSHRRKRTAQYFSVDDFDFAKLAMEAAVMMHTIEGSQVPPDMMAKPVTTGSSACIE